MPSTSRLAAAQLAPRQKGADREAYTRNACSVIGKVWAGVDFTQGRETVEESR